MAISNTRADLQTLWLAARGFVTNELQEQWRQFFNSASGNGAGQSADLSLNDAWRLFLKNKGNTEGSWGDMYRQELIKSLGGSSSSNETIGDLEVRFYGSTANTFI